MPPEKKYPLKGIYVPNLVPYDDKGRINERELRRMIRWLIDQGVSGLYPNGSTGEFIRLSFEERLRLVEIIADEVRGRIPILAGAAEGNVELSLKACQRYHELGCVAVSLTGPYYYKVNQEGIDAYFREMARNSPIDILVYNIPQFANEISLPVLRGLASDCERIIGIKDSSRDFPRVMSTLAQIKSERPDFTVFIGTEEILLPALLMGCDGGTIASGGVVPEAVLKLYERFKAGKIDEARQIQFMMLALIEAMFATGNFPDGFRLAVRLRGFDMGKSRQPLGSSAEQALENVAGSMACLLAECGAENAAKICREFKNEHRSNGTSNADVVDRIVREVLSRLQK
ncbi:MAG: dihydrodipicolinate synthase family protein [Opitutales bacterium]|nr:dihydrodipicolinate synthase family protein [Opitutales bacterium]